jgi:hypothetical protein
MDHLTFNGAQPIRSEPAPPPRKLEVFERELKGFAAGRCVLKIIEAHAEEVVYLVNHNRRVAAVWQRHQGPAFIRAIVDSGFDAGCKVPKTIKGVALSDLLLRMADMLQRHGTQKLRTTIGRHSLWVFCWAQECESLRELFERIHTGEGIR